MSEWKRVKLGDVINLKRGYDLPNSKRTAGKYPIISSSGTTDYHNEYRKEPPGVVTGRYGTIGKVFYTEQPYWPLNTTLYVTEFNGNDSKFIYFFLQSFDFDKFSDKSTVPGINRNHLHSETVNIPPLPEQRGIASVLSSLDDKIDLLHRQNQTLEQMAETLFRQWFVEEEKENWEVVLFEDFVKHVKPGTNYQPKRVDFGIPFLNVRCFNNGFINTSNSTYITQSEYERVHSKWVPEANDVLISRIGTLGLVAVITEENLPIAVHYNMINLKAKMSSYQFLYFLLKSKWFQEEYLTKARQSVQAYLAIDDVKSIELKLPIGTDEFMAKQEIFNALFDKIKSNQTQIRTLTALRDTLLPKLMSGEVRVDLIHH